MPAPEADACEKPRPRSVRGRASLGAPGLPAETSACSSCRASTPSAADPERTSDLMLRPDICCRHRRNSQKSRNSYWLAHLTRAGERARVGRAMANKATPLVQRMLGEATMKYAYREFQQAATLLLEVVRLAPGLPHAYQTLGLIYEESGQPVKALKLFMMAAHLSKRDVEAWKSLAALCRRYGEREQCVYCLQHVLALLPTDTGVQWERAQLLSELCLLYTSPSPRDATLSRMPSSA